MDISKTNICEGSDPLQVNNEGLDPYSKFQHGPFKIYNRR